MVEITDIDKHRLPSGICPEGKPAARQRVGVMAAAAVLRLQRTQKTAGELDEKARVRQVCIRDLRHAFKKMYVILGVEETDKLAPFAQSAEREEQIVKTGKSKRTRS